MAGASLVWLRVKSALLLLLLLPRYNMLFSRLREVCALFNIKNYDDDGWENFKSLPFVVLWLFLLPPLLFVTTANNVPRTIGLEWNEMSDDGGIKNCEPSRYSWRSLDCRNVSQTWCWRLSRQIFMSHVTQHNVSLNPSTTSRGNFR